MDTLDIQLIIFINIGLSIIRRDGNQKARRML